MSAWAGAIQGQRGYIIIAQANGKNRPDKERRYDIHLS
jgi:hypothetical protein